MSNRESDLLVCLVLFCVVFLGVVNLHRTDKALHHINHQLSQTVTCVLPEAATTTTVKR